MCRRTLRISAVVAAVFTVDLSPLFAGPDPIGNFSTSTQLHICFISPTPI
ncbi:MAG: hypothetical protein ABIV06_13325 [Thermoanaerobaculia bacterium]